LGLSGIQGKIRLSKPSLVMGAVAYAPKVVTIWEGFKA
jgi:hypothetical protein